VGAERVRYVFSITHSDMHWPAIVEVLAPQGAVGLIDDPDMIDVRMLKQKSASLHWELMFVRSLFGTPDMEEQHRLLTEVSKMVDAGAIRTTLTETLGRIDVAGLGRAHELVGSGRARGKVVLEGF
jgi:NADPH:quinone reductase-like Zn-dependent oxidoreductase